MQSFLLGLAVLWCTRRSPLHGIHTTVGRTAYISCYALLVALDCPAPSTDKAGADRLAGVVQQCTQCNSDQWGTNSPGVPHVYGNTVPHVVLGCTVRSKMSVFFFENT